MVALLVAITVMAIMMTAAMPAWHTMVQREKEAELVFRGEQIARAIGMYQRRFANAPAPSLEALVEQRFLRKKYKDPITNDDFQVLTAGMNIPGQTSSPAPAASGRPTQGRPPQEVSPLQQTADRARTAAASQGGRGFGAATGAIVGVTSKSTEKSLRLYNNQDTYNQWIFMPVAQAARAGGEGGRAGGRGADGRGGRGGDGRGAVPQGGRGLQSPTPGRF